MGTDAVSTRTTGALTAIAVAGAALTSLAAPAQAVPAAQGRATLERPSEQTSARPEHGSARAAAPTGLTARAWSVTDAATGQELGAKQAHRQLPPASTLKTLFALTVLPKFPADKVHKVTAADLKGVGSGSSLVGVKKGETYKVADLWRGVFLRSGNDAVHVLASMNGGWQATVKEMQATARELGAKDTTVKSPDGYDAPGQVSSAHDLSLFARKGLENADFARYCGTVKATFPGGARGGRTIVNTNRILAGSHGMKRYPGVIGVKNGYTSKAGNTLIAAAERDGRTIVATVLNPGSGKNAVYKEAVKLLDWGFKTAPEPAGTPDATEPDPQQPAPELPDVPKPDVPKSDVPKPDEQRPGGMPDVMMPDFQMPDMKMPDMKMPGAQLSEPGTQALSKGQPFRPLELPDSARRPVRPPLLNPVREPSPVKKPSPVRPPSPDRLVQTTA